MNCLSQEAAGWMSGARKRRRLGRSMRLRWVVPASVLLIVVVCLSGCRDSRERFIQGDWTYSVPSVGGVTSQTVVHTFWRFDDGTFQAHSCCDNRPGMEGQYRVVDSDEDTLVLELFDIEGAGPDDGYELTVVINRDGDSMKLQGEGPFLRFP